MITIRYRINDPDQQEAATAETLAAAKSACRVLTAETGVEHSWAPILPYRLRKHTERIERRIKHLSERIEERGQKSGVDYDRAEIAALLWVRGVLLAAHEEGILLDLDERRPV